MPRTIDPGRLLRYDDLHHRGPDASPSPASAARHMTMRKSAPKPFEVNHLWPLITHSRRSRAALVLIARGSEPGASGSVMEKPLSTVPSVRGTSHLRFCSSVPYFSRIVWLPELGATTPNSAAPPVGVSENLVHVGVFEEAEARAAIIPRQVRRPQIRGPLHLLLERRRRPSFDSAYFSSRPLRPGATPAASLRLVGQDLLVDDTRSEFADFVDVVAQAGGWRDGDRHGVVLRSLGPGTACRRAYADFSEGCCSCTVQRPVRARS